MRLRTSRTYLCIAAVLVLLSAPTVASEEEVTTVEKAQLEGDWPQWRGPLRNGGAPSFEPPETWPESLELVWKSEVGHSDASPVISGGKLFVFVRDGASEVAKALDLSTGTELWRSGYDAPHKAAGIVKEHGAGPYSTPTVADGRLFTYGITEVLSAWNTDTGELIWRKDFDGEFKRRIPLYGNSLSPVIAAGKLIVQAGGAGDGAIIAFEPSTGEELWRLPGDGPSYGSPQEVTLGGVEQLMMMTETRLVGIDPQAGKLLWEQPYKVTFGGGALSPAVFGDLVIASAFQRPTEAFRVSHVDGNWSIASEWSNGDVNLLYSSPILVDDKLIAFSSKKKGQLVMLDAKTGALLWEGEPRQGENAFLVSQGNTVLSAGDDGTVRVLAINGDGVEELGHYEVAQSALWNHPALLNQHLVIKDWSHVRVWRIPPVDSPN